VTLLAPFLPFVPSVDPLWPFALDFGPCLLYLGDPWALDLDLDLNRPPCNMGREPSPWSLQPLTLTLALRLDLDSDLVHAYMRILSPFA